MADNNPFQYLGAVNPPTRAIAVEVVEYLNKIHKPLPIYPEMGSSVIWGYNAGGAEHGTRNALDFMTRNTPDIGDAIVSYLWTHRARLGLVHFIWQQRIRSTKVSPGEWRPMEDRGTPTENHMDHVHAYFDGTPVAPLAVVTSDNYAHTIVRRGSVGADVRHAQTLLHSPTATPDGVFGAITERAVKYRQRVSGVTADGIVGPTTWRVLHKHDAEKRKA